MNTKSITPAGCTRARAAPGGRFKAGALGLHACTALCLALSAMLCRAHEPPVLPDLGDPSYSVMNLAEEKKLGRVILAQMRARLPLVRDIELQSYLQSLGRRLLAYSGERQNFDFNFLLVADGTVNAFATPGGVIAINTGLVAFSDSEDETAAVVAHEIAHVNRRHIARRYALSHRTQWFSALALIAGLIASTYNSDLGQLGLASAVSVPVEKQLAHSRTFEREADYSGMRLLSRAGYDPRGMVAFFTKLQARDGGHGVPEFLRTHPLNIERLRNMQARSAQYPAPPQRDSTAFEYAKARLAALGHAGVTADPGHREPPHIKLYRQGVELMQKRFPRRAIHILDQIKGEQHDALPVQLARAQAWLLQNDVSKAEPILRRLNRLHPDNVSVNHYLAELLLRTNRAPQALALLQKLTPLHGYHPPLIKLSAQAAAMTEKNGLSHEYLAEYNAASGAFDLALHHLKLADRETGANKVAKTRIEQKRKRILQLREEMQQQ